MIFFVIPLRSKYSSKNWHNVNLLFNNTIKSVYNQTDPDFKILVAIHDLPDLTFKVDDRVEFLKMNYEVPKNLDQQMLDKYYKKRYLMKRVKELGGGYVMMVDADDYISNRIAEYVNKNKHQNGYFMNNGYEFDSKNKYMQKAPRFYKLCGTSSIINYKETDLPEDISFQGYKWLNRDRPNEYIFDYGHTMWATLMFNQNRPLKPLPFRGAVYVINSGENHSQFSSNISKKRKLFRLIYPKFQPSAKLITEFSLNLE